MERNASPDPSCPHCRGTGRRVLFQLPEPCGCTEPTAVADAVVFAFVPKPGECWHDQIGRNWELTPEASVLINEPDPPNKPSAANPALKPYLDALAAIGPVQRKKRMFGEWPPAVQPEPEPKPDDRPLVYSERLQIAEEARGWLESHTNHFPSYAPFNVVTALDALGYLRRKPESRA